MAKATLKAATLAAGIVTGQTGVATQFQPVDGKIKSLKIVTGMIDKVLGYVRTRADMLKRLDAELPPVMLQTVYHAQKHGDVSLADRLVKGVWEQDATLAQELVFWYNKYTPVAWGPDKKAFLRDTAKKPFDMAGAEATPYHGETEVQTRREESRRQIQPFSSKFAYGRIAGLIGQLEKAQAEGGRGLAEGEDPGVIKAKLEQVVAYARGVFGITEDNVQSMTNGKAETPLGQAPESRLIAKGQERKVA